MSCPVCYRTHIDWQRPVGLGFCCGYRTPAEHYHETYEELLVCRGDATAKQAARAERYASARAGRKRRPRGIQTAATAHEGSEEGLDT